MSIHLAIQAAAALFLVVTATLMNTHTLRSAVVFQAIPAVLGGILGFFVVAQFMGWPV